MVSSKNLYLVKRDFLQQDYAKERERAVAVEITFDRKICKCLKAEATRSFLLQGEVNHARKNLVRGHRMKGCGLIGQ